MYESKVPMRLAPNPGAYVQAWRLGLECARSGRGLKVDWCTVLEPHEIRPWFTDALQRRINARGGFNTPRGRKDNYDQYCSYGRDARAIQARLNTRLRVHQFETAEARRRFSHLLADRNDY